MNVRLNRSDDRARPYRVRAMDARDGAAVLRIYGEGLATGLATFETTVPAWEEWNARHLAVCRYVAAEEGAVVGFAALSPVSARPCYRGVAEVSEYVASGARGRGIGRELLEVLVSASEAAGIWTLQASIFAKNSPSRALHVACGFREVGVRERIAQRDGVWHDTVLLERRSRRSGPA